MRSLVVHLLALAAVPLFGQADSSVYRLRAGVDIPVTLVGVAGFISGMNAQAERPPLTVLDLGRIDSYNVPGFDRAALRIDPSGQDRAMRTSDRILYGTMVAPALLLFDDGVRREWTNVFGMYIEAAAITSGTQAWSCVASGRYRPIAYIPTATFEQRIDQRNSHSFYSGHTANTAVASFFMAKVLDDMHPELGGKRWLLYGAAAIPPALVGYYRIEAGKHFPTDVLAGAALGAATGILVPELHKRAPLNGRLTAMPIASTGLLGMHVAFKW